MPFKWPGVLLAHHHEHVESNLRFLVCWAAWQDHTQSALFSGQLSEAPRQCPLTEKVKNREVKSLTKVTPPIKFQSERLKQTQSDYFLALTGLWLLLL